MEFNVNNLSSLSNQFKSNVAFIIDGAEEEMLWCKTYEVPTLTMTPDEIVHTPYNIKVPTQDFQYGDLSLDFYVDEEYKNFKFIIDWMMKFYKGDYLDTDIVNANLFLFNNQLTKVISRVQYSDMFPVSFNGFSYDNLTSDENLIMNISFMYNKWELK
jgi:hypothetical protein